MGNCPVANMEGLMPIEGQEGPRSPVWEHLQVELEKGWCLLRASKASVPHGTMVNLRVQKQHYVLSSLLITQEIM